MNPNKSEIVHFKRFKDKFRGFDESGNFKSLQYLGFEFDGCNIFIRSASMSRYYKRMTSRIRENLKAAFGKNYKGDQVFKKKLHNRYTCKGERNFITYARRAKEIMESSAIHNQYKNSYNKVNKIYLKKKEKFENNLRRKGKLKKMK